MRTLAMWREAPAIAPRTVAVVFASKEDKPVVRLCNAAEQVERGSHHDFRNSTMIRPNVLAATLLASLATPTCALAQPVTFAADDAGKSVTVEYDGFNDAGTVDGLASNATFTLTGVEDDLYGDAAARFFNFDYSIANASSVPSELLGFAFRTNPAGYAIGFVDGAFEDFEGASHYGHGIGPVNACFGNFGDPSNCENKDAGISAGEVGFGTFRLAFYDTISFLTFDNLFVGYDSIGGAESASGRGTITSVSSGGPVSVPEPGMLSIFALSLGALAARQRGFARHRRLAR